MTDRKPFHRARSGGLDAERITSALEAARHLRRDAQAQRRLGISGGVDSAVVLGIAVRALGRKGRRPVAAKKESSPDSAPPGPGGCRQFGVERPSSKISPPLWWLRLLPASR
ncbi:MAG: hypothetical protein M5U34_09000 [Chloroflexi bacterium]|nr:hypothetical protein [Chloroflexota bacterium]